MASDTSDVYSPLVAGALGNAYDLETDVPLGDVAAVGTAGRTRALHQCFQWWA